MYLHFLTAFIIFLFLAMPSFANTDEEACREFLARAAMHMLLLEDGRGNSHTSLFN